MIFKSPTRRGFKPGVNPIKLKESVCSISEKRLICDRIGQLSKKREILARVSNVQKLKQ